MLLQEPEALVMPASKEAASLSGADTMALVWTGFKYARAKRAGLITE